VVQLIETERLSDVILLGHSYGGMVLSGVIDRIPTQISAAIYSDAYVPDDAQSCFELANDGFREMFLSGAARDGFSVPPPPGLDPRTAPHPLASFIQKLRLKNPLPPIRRGYVFLSGWPDTPFKPVYERLRHDAAWRTFSIPVSHNVIRDAFDELLEIALQFT
jgi:pimeloyl-ACP methyl ester carboxylesterase